MRSAVKLFAVLFLCLLTQGACGQAQTFDLKDLPLAGRSYLAPITSFGVWRMVLPDGGVREFQLDPARTNRLFSDDGWSGEIRGRWIRVMTPGGRRPREEWCYENGTLRILSVGGRACGIEYPAPVSYVGRTIPPLWPDGEDLAKSREEVKSNWKNDGKRLQLWFTSPNRTGAFLAGVVLAALVLLLRKRGIWRALGALIGVGSVAMLVWTGSRGAFLGLAVGLIVVLFCELRRRAASCRMWFMVVGCGLAAIGVLGGVLYGTMRTRRENQASDQQRMTVFQAIPRMMSDAPEGWGSYRQVGLAYFNWYQGREDNKLRNNLIGDQETRLVGLGWVKGGLYLWLWAGGLICLLGLAWRGANPLPAAAWCALAITSSLNLIFGEPSVFVLPVLSLLLLLPSRPWRQWKFLSCLAGVGLLLTCAFLFVVRELADRTPRSRPHICREGNRILIGGRNPVRWVVDDGKALGGASAPQEIRRYFEGNMEAMPIGYVRSLDDLPPYGSIRKLMLAGEACRKFLDRIASGVNTLPQDVVFVSPPFPVSSVPEDICRRAKVEVRLGEFAARYDSDAKKFPPWVKVVPGAEVYLPSWPSILAGH